jgi:putative tricarboxylic transport membrane protein
MKRFFATGRCQRLMQGTVGAVLAGMLLAGSACRPRETPADAAAGDWHPTRAVTLIVPSNPGGAHDVTARLVASVMEKYARQPIVVFNQAAGGGVVAYNQMLRAKPDGLTVGQIAVSAVSDQFHIAGVTYNKNSYAYLGQISSDQNLLVVNATGPYGAMTAPEFLLHAKRHPGEVAFGVSGNWTNHDYTRFQIAEASGAAFLRVPLKGGAEIVLALLSGDVHAGALYPSEVKSQIDAGNLKVLAHNGDRPLQDWPDVPSFTSLGLAVDMALWRVLVVSRETPPEILAGWRRIVEETMTDPAIQQACNSVSITCVYRNAAETETLVAASEDAYRRVSIKAGLTPGGN